MSISFVAIPADIRVPGTYVEYDGAKATSGPQIKPFRVLVIGQRLTAGTVAQGVPTQVTSVEQARLYFGNGSMLHKMAQTYFINPHEFDTWFIAFDDAVAGVAASLTITVGGTATAAGTIFLYIGGQRVTVAVASGDLGTVVAQSIRDAVTAAEGIPVAASGAGSSVILTYKHKGETGNSIDVRLNYNPGEATPAGVTLGSVPGSLAGGTTNPTLGAGLWSAIGEVQYDVIINPYTDATNLTAIDVELASRWGPLRQIDSWAISAKRETQVNLSTFGNAANTKHMGVVGQNKSLNPPYQVAGAVGANMSFALRNDPVDSMRGVRLYGILAPAFQDRFTFAERELLLRDGISTLNYGPGGDVYIERLITLYEVNPAGAPDIAFLDAYRMFNLSYQRWDLRRRFLTKYARHKLAGDTIRIASGQRIMTPKVGRAEAVAAFLDWEALGLVQDVEQFKKDLIVELNAADPTRLDFVIPTRQVSALYIVAMKIEFRL